MPPPTKITEFKVKNRCIIFFFDNTEQKTF